MDLAFIGLGLGAAASGVLSGLALHPRSPIGSPVFRLDASGGMRLTFDDGPCPEWTPRVLDRLDRIGAKASFFMLGAHLENNEALVRECAARGHRVELHGMSHRVASFQRPGALARELEELADAVEALTSRRPRWYRPPYGARPLLSRSLGALRLVTWSWSCGDWAGGDRGAIAPARPGDVLLLHDGPTGDPAARARTLEALDVLAALGPLVALDEPKAPKP